MTEIRREPKKNIIFLYGAEVCVENVTGEDPSTCAYLGPEGTYTEQAAVELAGTQFKYQSLERIREVVRSVEQGKFDLGLIPVENSTEGPVLDGIKELIHSRLVILGERVIPIHHFLFGTQEALKKGVVHSHPQAIGQCNNWLDEHLPPNMTIVRHNSTAEAVKNAVIEGDVAIGSQRAGELYKAPVLAEKIEDYQGNTTRFWLVGRGETAVTGKDRTALLFSFRQGIGFIRNALSALADRRISVNRIDSFPMGALDQYYFILTFSGHNKESNIAEALEDFSRRCLKMKVLGSYHRAPIAEPFFEPAALENGWAFAEDINAVP